MRRGDRLGTLLRGVAALITLLALVVGLPLLLLRLGGSPIPRHLGSWHQLRRGLLQRDSNGQIFLAAVRDVSWLAWAAFTAAVLAEAQAAVRGRAAPALRLGGLQTAAGRLVALALLAFSAPSALLLPAQQTAAVASVSAVQPGAAGSAAGAAVTALPKAAQGAASPSAASPSVPHEPLSGQPAARTPGPPLSQVMSMGFSQMVTVRQGDCLWTIAQRYLGDGDRYPEIVKLNLGHDMGSGQRFADPSLIWPGWVLQLPATGHAAAPAQHPGPATHGAHPSREPRFRRPHPSAHPANSFFGGAQASSAAAAPASSSAAGPASPGAGSPNGTTRPGASPAGRHQAAPGSTAVGAGRHAGSGGSPATQAALAPARVPAAGGNTGTAAAPYAQPDRIPPLAIFAAGMLAGGAAVTLAQMRHRQRQSRRPRRRIPLPVSAPVMVAEQRMRAEPELQPATALRAALGGLGAGLASSARQIPEITGIRVSPDSLEILLASPASEPPPPPFTVPGGRQGMAWHLSLPADALPPLVAAGGGDLLPGLVTAGAVEDGYLLVDLEYLQVTTVEGPAELADRVLATAAAELATSQLAGWYELILAGFPELAESGGRATSCDSLEEALDLLAAKAVSLRRRLGDEELADVRQHRLSDPYDEDWALTLLVSRLAPTPGQLALLLDLCGDPAGMAALVPAGADAGGGHQAPASMVLAADPGRPGGITARIDPLGLVASPQPLREADYAALANMFTVAAQDYDVAADAAPYDGSWWPPRQAAAAADIGLDEDFYADAAWLPGDEIADRDDPASGADGPDGGGWPGADGLPPAGDDPRAGAYLPAAADLRAEADPPARADPPADTEPPPGMGPLGGAGQAGAAHLPGASTAAEASLRIGVLGTFTINGAPAALLPAQSQLVLALALNGRDGLSNQQLCYLLGADPDHPRPSDSLRQLIVRTRRQLGRAPDGREWIEHLGAGQYALHLQARFDWDEFDQLARAGLDARDAACLRQAIGLIRGQPFTACYPWWLDIALTETVRAQIVDAAEMLAELELADGNPAAAARAARTGLAGDAAAEQLWRALMRAEHAAGNLTGVREAWNRCLDAISEIAADGQPHPQTAALYRELLAQAGQRPAWARD